jgi:hypothetical protein
LSLLRFRAPLQWRKVVASQLQVLKNKVKKV